MTGCSKLVSLADLNRESGWETLSERKNKHKRILFFFKLINGLVPFYLNCLVPVPIGSTSFYNLKGSHNLQGIACRTNLYLNSFLPSDVTDWNALPIDVRNLDFLSAFKCHIIREKPNPNTVSYRKEKGRFKSFTLGCELNVVTSSTSVFQCNIMKKMSVFFKCYLSLNPYYEHTTELDKQYCPVEGDLAAY